MRQSMYNAVYLHLSNAVGYHRQLSSFFLQLFNETCPRDSTGSVLRVGASDPLTIWSFYERMCHYHTLKMWEAQGLFHQYCTLYTGANPADVGATGGIPPAEAECP